MIESYEQYEESIKRINLLYSGGHQGSPEADELAAALAAYERDELGIEHRLPREFNLEWYVGKVADLESKKARIQAQADAMIADEDRAIRALEWRYGALVDAALREQLTGRRRSVKFLTGTIGLRKTPARVSVEDLGAFIQEMPEDLRGEVLTVKADTAALNRLVKVVDGQAFRVDTGESITINGLKVTPEGEKLYVKAGKEES